MGPDVLPYADDMVQGAADESSPSGNGAAALGVTVRSARTRLGLSVQALAQSAGVSLGLVSQVEHGKGNPSLQSIQRLAKALGMSAGRLLEPPVDALTVVTADERHVLRDENADSASHPLRELLSPAGDPRIQLIRTVLPPGFSNESQPFRHIGTESITVVSGALLLGHGEERRRLAAGDSATYACSTPHWWANDFDADTVVLGAFTPLDQ